MKKTLFLFSLLSLLFVQYGCESNRGEDFERQEQQMGPATEEVIPAPQSAPEHGGAAGNAAGPSGR
jgi:hypothetical protein